jgi:hypothetical protein
MTYKIRYHRGETEFGDAETAETLEEARWPVHARTAALDHGADFVIIFRISPSGTEELEESRKLHG